VGWVKDAKADNLGKEAARAMQEGRVYFTPKLNTPLTQHALSGSIAGWAEQIEALERLGWVLLQWSVAHDSKDRPEAYPLFRRRQ
jgi:hypothetical protein